jgi:DnaJ-class molecular chaperone
LLNSDHYQLLDVARNADRRTICAAYRKALRRHHPGANSGNSEGEQLLRQVLTAGRVLTGSSARPHRCPGTRL